MQFSAPTTRITDKWLFAMTVVFVVALLVLFTNNALNQPRQYFWPAVTEWVSEQNQAAGSHNGGDATLSRRDAVSDPV